MPSDTPARPEGALILVHDATQDLQTQRELESKMALVREVHHRVKNNLQVVASLMRMQARRVQSAEAKSALEESVNRILSVAVVKRAGDGGLLFVEHYLASKPSESKEKG